MEYAGNDTNTQVAPVSGSQGVVLGKVISVRGPVVDVRFERVNDLPALYDVLIGQSLNKKKVVMEVSEHLSKNDVRCIALSETLNLQLNSKVVNTQKPVSVRTGDELYGRIINVFGDPVDNMPGFSGTEFKVTRRPPRLEQYDLKSKFSAKPEFLETGIKYLDVLFPLCKGKKNIEIFDAGFQKFSVALVAVKAW